MTWPLIRGQVVRADIGLDEPKLFVVISNNMRNRNLLSVLTARLTTSDKPKIPSVVDVNHPEVFVGRVVCDDIVEIYEDEVVSVVGGFTASTMKRINVGLAAALSLNVN